MTEGQRDNSATIMGLLMAIITTTTFIDFDNFDVKSVNQWRDLIIAISPAVAGFYTKLKGKTLNDAAKPTI